ncbi:chromosomal replication initiator DnaA [Acidisphaera sp. S103]|uniref:chromosomal replication initiator DnaA n=1 Tax=Acidisphaera sp. S103 TaxID=1747223 RepID=UPI001C2080D0|nr:chromosomal replication initiator DnaA [Acidisphaera sp. S103]
MPSERLQLLLPFPYAPGYDARDFLPAASNREALAWLDADWPDRRLALFGPAGCGKSHLLHIWAERSGARILTGQMLTEQTLPELDDMSGNGALALDDADTARPDTVLLHLLNTARDRGLRVVLAGRAAPSRWPVRLADLSSRLRAITAVEIRPPSDDLLAALLVHLLADRQLNVAQPVQDWLLTRLPRSPSVLRQVVAQLDRTSLVVGKPITRALAAGILADGGFAIAEGDESAIADGDEVSMSGVDPSSQPPGFL